MATDGLRIELDTPTATPGATVAGTLMAERALEARSVAVVLELIERTTRGEPATRSFDRLEVAGAGPVPMAARWPFELQVPADAVPSFTTAHGKVQWTVRATADIAGPDPQAIAELTVAGPRSPIGPAAATALAEEVARSERVDRRANGLLGWTFVAIGVAIAAFTAFLGARPPDSWEDGSAGGIVAFGVGLGAFLVVCGAIVLWAQRGAPITSVRLVPDSVVHRPGDTVTARFERSGDEPLSVGLETFEVVERVSRPNGGSPVVSHQEYVIAAQWQPLPTGTGEVSFQIPPDTLPTHVGRPLVVGTRLAVVPVGKEASRRNRSRHRVALVVRS